MATVLENYYGYRQQLLQRMAQPPISPADLWLYGEILYRIGVLETCQMYLRSAPITREVPCLQGHYMMLVLTFRTWPESGAMARTGAPIRRKSGMRLRSIWSG